MIIDGKAIAARIYEDLRMQVMALPRTPRLAVFTCAPNFETQKFLAIKRVRAEALGIVVSVQEFAADTIQADVCTTIAHAAASCDGIVVQLPFPVHIARGALIAAIPQTHDVDAFLIHDPLVPPPVIGAMQEIMELHKYEVRGKRAVVIGNGALVGAPAARWLTVAGADVTVLTKEEPDCGRFTRSADLVVLGAGVPGLLTPDMVREGVVILDAGTSEEGGVLRGDADPACAEKASLFTPVPGGIGPITIAVLLRNLVVLASRKK